MYANTNLISVYDLRLEYMMRTNCDRFVDVKERMRKVAQSRPDTIKVKNKPELILLLFCDCDMTSCYLKDGISFTQKP